MPPTITCVIKNAARVRVADRAAALSYYMLLAIVPVLGFTVLLGGLVVEQARVEAEIVGYAQSTLGGQVANLFGEVIGHAAPGDLLPLILAGGFVFAYATVRLFSILQTTLADIFMLPKPPLTTLWARLRYGAGALTFGLVLLGLMAVELMVAIGARALSNEYLFAAESIAARVLSFFFTFILTTFFFGALYRIFSHWVVPWWHALWAGVVSAVLYGIGTTVFSFLFAASTTFDIYGLAAPLMLLVVWLYYVMRTIMFGAILAGCSAEKIVELSDRITSP